MIDSIEYNVRQAEEYVADGGENIKEAEKAKEKSMKVKIFERRK